MTDKITEDDVVAALRKSLSFDVRRKQIEWADDADETQAQEAERMQAAADFRDMKQAYIWQFEVMK